MPGLSAVSSAALLALLAGLAIGKAWERYKLRDGKWIDRRRARDSHHYVLGLNFLVANQLDHRHRGAEPGGAGRRRRARDPSDSRQRLSRARPGRARHPDSSGAAAAAQAHPRRARLRPALPGPRLQARRVRRSRARSVQRGAAARSERTSTRCSICRSCTKSSISGTRRTASGSSWSS